MSLHPGQNSAALTENEVTALRALFPILDRPSAEGLPGGAYLDWAATGQRPAPVVDAERDFLFTQNAAVHRGASMITGHATEAFEAAREKVARFVGRKTDEIVWTENATDALNLVAGGIAEASAAFAGARAPGGPSAAAMLGVPGSERLAIGPGDEILITEAEHHANLIPWQRLAARTGATLRFIPVREDGTWTVDDARAALNARTRVFAFGHVSNVTGFVAPVAELVELARTHGTITVLDACQSVPHLAVDLDALGVDFAAFSAHKMLGPYGLGVLAGRAEMLALLPPARTGGSTITTVTMERAEFLPPPQRFEAGTQPVSQVIALGAAVDLLTEVGMDRIAAHEHALVARLVDGLSQMPGVRLLGPRNPDQRVALASIDIEGVHAHDAGQFLDDQGLSVRVGHHCAQPLHRALGVTASVRCSVHLTSTADEIDRFLSAVRGAQEYFGVLPAESVSPHPQGDVR